MKTLTFFAVLLTALALAPGAAHLLSLPNKIGLPQEQYFIAQGVYAGWAWTGVLLFAAMFVNLALAVMMHRRSARAPAALAFAGFVLIAVMFGIFFAWTYPANVATANWTRAPANWQALREQWEYSHAANAFVMLAALCSVISSALLSRG
jgi:hypothetical protein